jgi:hypothetical protein
MAIAATLENGQPLGLGSVDVDIGDSSAVKQPFALLGVLEQRS